MAGWSGGWLTLRGDERLLDVLHRLQPVFELALSALAVLLARFDGLKDARQGPACGAVPADLADGRFEAVELL